MTSSKAKIDLSDELSSCKTMEDLCGKNGLLQRLLGNMVEQLLEAEMDQHLGYSKHSPNGNNSGNSRNGKTSKKVMTTHGLVEIETPRDRNGDFEPEVVKKRQTQLGSFDEKIISMYAKGMTTRDIQDHIKEIYGADISPTSVSYITEKVVEVAKEWQCRPLEKLYPIIFFDAIQFKVHENGKVISKASYTCLGIDAEGKKDVLGIWVGESEGARFWLRVFTELKNRGVKDIFIACVDGLKRLPEAINAVFPDAEVQLCIIHMIRNSCKYVPHKHLKEFVQDLKLIYKAETEDKAENNLNKMQAKWGDKYPLAVLPWVNHWENIRTFLKFPEYIRRIIYTTNAVESLHKQIRKTTKTKGSFPNDQALTKMLYLTIVGISKKWTMPLRGWKEALSQFAIVYGDRMQIAMAN